MSIEQLTVLRIWRETITRVEFYSKRVQEGRDLMAALDFGRFVLWSGIIELCKSNPSPAPLTVDGALLNWKVEELIRDCQERFRLNDKEPHVTELQLQSIHEKIDKMGWIPLATCGRS